jgi:hypothetical protein
MHMYGIIILNQVQYIRMFSFTSDVETQKRTRRSGIDAAYLPRQLQSAALPNSGLCLPCITLSSHIDIPLQQTEPGSHTCSDTSTSLQVSGGLPAGATAPTAALGDRTPSLAAAATARPHPLPGAHTSAAAGSAGSHP